MSNVHLTLRCREGRCNCDSNTMYCRGKKNLISVFSYVTIYTKMTILKWSLSITNNTQIQEFVVNPLYSHIINKETNIVRS